jgi:hypothetical protein
MTRLAVRWFFIDLRAARAMRSHSVAQYQIQALRHVGSLFEKEV